MPPKHIPKAPIRRLISDAGAERVSEGIVDYIGELMEDYAKLLAKKAIVVCKFREQKVVKRSHLESALRIEEKE